MSAVDVLGVSSIWTTYRVELQVRTQMVGGVPGDPNLRRAWLQSKLELDAPALEELFTATIAEVDAPMTVEQKMDALLATDTIKINVFKRHPDTKELVYESRCMKAALKEWSNSVYPGNKFPGQPQGIRKGLKNYAAEALHVDGDYIGLGVYEPSDVEERIKHVFVPGKGPTGTINRVELVEAPRLSFTLRVRHDFMPRSVWGEIWQAGEEIGIGADRARSDGKFDLIAFDRQ